MVKSEIIINFIRKFKLRTRLAVFLMLFIIIPSIVIFQSTKLYTSKLIKIYLNNYVELTQQKIESGTRLLIDEINMLSLKITSSQDIYNIIAQTDLNEEDKRKQLRIVLNKLIDHREIIGDIIIFTQDNKMYRYTDSNNTLDTPDLYYIQQIKNSNTPVWGKIKKDVNNNAYILLGKHFQNFYTSYRLGTLIIYFNERALYDIYKDSITDENYSFIIFGDNYVLSHPDKEKVGTMFFEKNLFDPDSNTDFKHMQYNNEPFIIKTHMFTDEGNHLLDDWKVVSMISYRHLFKTIFMLNRYIIIIQIAIIIFSVFVALLLSKKITQPMSRLKNEIKLFGNETMDIKLFPENINDEIWALEKSFNDMVTQIKDLIKKNNEEKEKQRQAELQVLQAQINPHFIYNVLDAISWLAKIRKQPDIEKMVFALASFFRISLHKGDRFITVQEEIQHVQSYVTIEQMRFPNHIDIEYDISEDIMSFKIPKIILQPLVENAIKHGISTKKEKGHIHIIGYRMENDIRFEIIDNGVGFDLKTLNNEDTEHNDTNKPGGYGIRNIKDRISIEYGPDYGLSFYSKIGVGTRVEIKLQIKENL